MAEAEGRVADLAIIGGGVNGCGIARDAAGRGLSVVLLEQGDLAQATSSASTKLLHGGLRYLEYWEFRLVREALIEREVLLGMMPHIARPLRFVLPHHRGLRPAWMLRLGLFIYDHLGGRKLLPPTRDVDLVHDPVGEPLRPEFARGFEYSDVQVDDARLVVLNARDAARRGATVLTRTRCEEARREGGFWRIRLRDMHTGETRECAARALINAAGPWVEEVIRCRLHEKSPAHIRLVRGSHIVTRRLFAHDRAYIFQQSDGRIVFAIPFDDDFTLIGTTECDHEGDPGEARCTEAEADYLVAAVNGYLREPIGRDDILWRFAGVRPLYDDGASSATQATRDYVLKLSGDGEAAPLLNVFGGKITTYRRLAEAALAKLRPFFPAMGDAWTAGAALPGGDFRVGEEGALVEALRADFSFLNEAFARRLVRTYGTEARALLGDAREPADLGRPFGSSLTEREVMWLMGEEWAETAEDILWRRTKLGLRLSAAEAEALVRWLDEQRGAPAARLGRAAGG